MTSNPLYDFVDRQETVRLPGPSLDIKVFVSQCFADHILYSLLHELTDVQTSYLN